jgi:hypothetical protein
MKDMRKRRREKAATSTQREVQNEGPRKSEREKEREMRRKRRQCGRRRVGETSPSAKDVNHWRKRRCSNRS